MPPTVRPVFQPYLSISRKLIVSWKYIPTLYCFWPSNLCSAHTSRGAFGGICNLCKIGSPPQLPRGKKILQPPNKIALMFLTCRGPWRNICYESAATRSKIAHFGYISGDHVPRRREGALFCSANRERWLWSPSSDRSALFHKQCAPETTAQT